MTTISAQVIADSVSEAGHRLTTLMLRYPRCIHSEFMTHRQFSRNASSSRAIPVERLIKDIIDDPFIPMYWGKNQKGMQAREECNDQLTFPLPGEILDKYSHDELSLIHTAMYGSPSLTREEAWSYAMVKAIQTALAFDKAGYHKQLVNRLLEPFAHINVLVTATEWGNFFALRLHEDAEPHINLLAFEMKNAMDISKPRLLQNHQWHMPYISEEESDTPVSELMKISVARCARVSYLTHDGKKPNLSDDLALYDHLVGSKPLHASPAEHICSPSLKLNDPATANLRGWISLRKFLPGECQ